ncbi:hypothetical protein CY35_03G015800 [Sphagnum magellanicum]|nr:hypothetical protein CY35_03G015800 [Sphagnum magellanicum]
MQHDDWNAIQDAKALQFLEPDLVLFTGDFGEENVELVRDISNLDFPKAVILGNHDAWWSTYNLQLGPSEGERDGVQAQLDLLGKAHVGYSRLDFAKLKLSVVGGRPFSSGGRSLSAPRLCKRRYAVRNLKESAEKITAAALQAPPEHSLVFLAHNGPAGLGSQSHDICGKDWIQEGGDHGDSDLENAIAAVKQKGLKVPLVVFGHMHQSLQLGPILERTMVVVGSDRTVYLNAAVVPRVRYKMISQTGSLHRNNLLDGVGRFGKEVESKHDTEHSGTSLAGALHRLDLGIGITERHFVLVDFDDGEVKKIKEVWVAIGDGACTDEQKILYSSDSVPASS